MDSDRDSHEEDFNGNTHDPTFPPIVSPISQSKKTKSKQKSYRKKVETSWSQEQIFKLIQEVESRRSLWDAGCAEYKLHKDSIWQEVADAIPVSFNDCKGKWVNLRTTFNSNLEKYRKKKSGQGTDESISITWKYFKPMMFLETNKVRQSTQSTSSMKLESAATDESIVNDLGFSEELASITPSMSGQRRKRKTTPPSSLSPTLKGTTHKTDLKEMAVQALQSMRSVGAQPKDTSTAFGDYIAAELRSLTPEQAVYAKGKLRRAFNDIMDEVAMMSPLQERQQLFFMEASSDPNDVLLLSPESSGDAIN